MKIASQLLTTCIIMMLLASTTAFGQKKATTATPAHTHMDSDAAGALIAQMRKLWGDHGIWTRNVILCIVDDLPGKNSGSKAFARKSR